MITCVVTAKFLSLVSGNINGSGEDSHRIQTFMWFIVRGKLLTNAERHKWSEANSPIFQACNHPEETQMHVLRDCVYATRVWL